MVFALEDLAEGALTDPLYDLVSVRDRVLQIADVFAVLVVVAVVLIGDVGGAFSRFCFLCFGAHVVNGSETLDFFGLVITQQMLEQVEGLS